MVAQAPTTPLPTLSRPDKLRLTLYFSLGQSVEALALELQDIHRDHQDRLKTSNPTPATFLEALTTENTALAPFFPANHSGPTSPHAHDSSAPHLRPSASSAADSASYLGSSGSSVASSSPPPDAYDLAAWTLSDPIAPHIAYRRAESLERRKQSALAELDAILADAATSPIEKRRAATTMLRMLASQLTRNRAPSAASPSPSSPERGGGGGPALRGGGGSVSTPSTHAPSFSRAPSSPTANAHNSSSPHSVTASLNHSVSASPPPPDPAAKALIRLTLNAIHTPQDLKARAALEPHLTPQATINHEPILNLESQLSAISPELKVTQIVPDDYINLSPGPPESRTSISSLMQDGRSNRYQITLTRADSGSWLLSSVDTIKNTS